MFFGGRTNGLTERKLRKREEENQGLVKVNADQFKVPFEDGRYWIPIKALSDIPPTFYMPDRFEG